MATCNYASNGDDYLVVGYVWIQCCFSVSHMYSQCWNHKACQLTIRHLQQMEGQMMTVLYYWMLQTAQNPHLTLEVQLVATDWFPLLRCEKIARHHRS